jgi:hypothetical protein
VAGAGLVAVEPVNRASGLAVASGCRIMPTLAALGVGCREHVRQGWQGCQSPGVVVGPVHGRQVVTVASGSPGHVTPRHALALGETVRQQGILFCAARPVPTVSGGEGEFAFAVRAWVSRL